MKLKDRPIKSSLLFSRNRERDRSGGRVKTLCLIYRVRVYVEQFWICQPRKGSSPGLGLVERERKGVLSTFNIHPFILFIVLVVSDRIQETIFHKTSPLKDPLAPHSTSSFPLFL